ncbi:MAG: glycosyltransferase [Candidatus Eremiobacteraeota bacterium]|nr:glycosyltransferase [Candidatus Eremiobacteraeota bacterium]
MLKILHAPHGVAGNAYTLSKAERALGCLSDTMVFAGSALKFPVNNNLELEKVPRWPGRWRTLSFFLKACLRYEVFHFNFGGSLFSWYPSLALRDLPLLKAMGKKIFHTFQGCDVRSRALSLAKYQTSACHYCDFESCNDKAAKRKAEAVRIIARYADKIYVVNPDLLPFVPGAEFLPYASVDPREWTPSPRPPQSTLTILHAPTSRTIKGTHFIIEAIEALKKKGIPLRLLLVENVPYGEARELYRQAHLAVDQLHAGWYGAFAVETMAMGIPTLCYLRDEDMAHLPFRERIPIVRTSKETLADDLLALVESEPLRREIGEKSRAFVEDIHDPYKIAERLINDYMTSR